MAASQPVPNDGFDMFDGLEPVIQDVLERNIEGRLAPFGGRRQIVGSTLQIYTLRLALLGRRPCEAAGSNEFFLLFRSRPAIFRLDY